MKIFFSAVKKNHELQFLVENGAKNFLFSFEDPKVIKNIEFLNDFANPEITIIVDSGAFSAFNRGAKIDIDKYCEFIGKVKELAKNKVYFFNLDVIPHIKGTTPTKQQLETAASKGIENWKYIRNKGHATIHTYHQFEGKEILDRILNECNELNYIGISPANDQSLQSRNKWLSETFFLLRNTVRTHCLGLTAKESLEIFPVYSADSSSHLNVSRFGELFDYKRLIKEPKKDMNRHNIFYYDEKCTHEYSFKYYINLEKYVSSLWSKKGVTWEN